MKWFIIGLIALVAIAIATGQMGGARDAAGNYGKIMRGVPAK